MPEIRFRDAAGDIVTVRARGGMSLMEAAVQNGIDAIQADCGGACSCATCHVYVDAEWMDRVGPPAADEAGMLDMVADRRAGSRLACQIALTDALDGLIVETPLSQLSQG